MPALIYLLTAGVLCLIALQDFRSRAVTWFFFPAVAICGTGLALSELKSAALFGRYAAINLGFLLLQLGLLWIWFVVRKKRTTSLIDQAIGKGDLLFWVAAGCFFSPVNYILYYLLSLIFALLVHLVFQTWVSIRRFPTVPLAGYQAVFLAVWLSLHLLLHIPLTDDHWITTKLLPE